MGKIKIKELPNSISIKKFDYELPGQILIVQGFNKCLSSHLAEHLSNQNIDFSTLPFDSNELELEKKLKGKSAVIYADSPTEKTSERETRNYVAHSERLLHYSTLNRIEYFILASHSNAATSDDSVSQRIYHVERLVQSYSGNMKTCIVRHQNLFGPYDNGFLTHAIELRKSNRLIFARGKNSTIDFSFSGNVSHAYLLALQALKRGKLSGGNVLNVSDEEPGSYECFVGEVLTGLGFENQAFHLPQLLLEIIALFFKFLSVIVSPIKKYEPFIERAQIKRQTVGTVTLDGSNEKISYEPLWKRHEAMMITIDALNRNISNRAAGAKIEYEGPWSLDEVSKHKDESDAWIVVDGKVYCVSGYLEQHPGGDAMLRNVGGDSTEGFRGPHHPEQAREILNEYYIGDLKD